MLELDLLLDEWPEDHSWLDSAPNAFELYTLIEVTWSENWGERGWSWSEQADVAVNVKCFSPNSENGTWLVEDSAGQQLTLVDSMILQSGWQNAEVPMKIKGTSDYLDKGNYQLIWKDQNGENRTRLNVLAKEEEQ